MKKSKILIPVVVLLVLIVGGGGFFGGMRYQKSKTPARMANRGQGIAGRFQNQGTPVSGEIIDKDEKSITVKLQDGSSRIIFISDSTQINKQAPGTKDDLTKGTQVFATGSENPDKSITANSIQIGGFKGQ